MRNRSCLRAAIIAIILISTACAGGDPPVSQSTGPEPTAIPDPAPPESDNPDDVDSEKANSDDEAQDADSEETPERWDWFNEDGVTDESVIFEIEPQPTTYADLKAAQVNGETTELEVALTGFALLFGSIDGAQQDVVDGGARPASTSVLATLSRLHDDLSPAQLERIDAETEALFAAEMLIFETDPGVDPGAIRRNRPARPLKRQPGTPASDELTAIAQEANEFMVAQLGGTAARFRLYLNNDMSDLGITTALGPSAAPSGCDIAVNLSQYPDTASNRSTIAHEVFHCWHWMNSPTTWFGPGWITEGVAEWVGEEFAGGSPSGAENASGLTNVSRYSLYGSEYAAVAFYWEIEHLLGSAAQIWNRIPDVIAQTESSVAFGVVTGGIPETDLATLASMPVLSAGIGRSWTFDSPVTGLRGRQPLSRRGLWSGVVRANAGEQTFAVTGWSIGTGQPVWIETTTEGPMIQRWRGGDDEVLTSPTDNRYCSDGECLCSDGRQLHPEAEQVPNGRLNIFFAVAGGADSVSEARWNLVDVAEACGDEDPTALQTSGTGLIGTWRASPTAIARAFEQAFDEGGLDVAGVGGDLLLTLNEGGEATLEYDDVRVFVNDAALRSVILTGSGTLRWGVARGQLRFTGVSDFAITATADTFLAGEVPGLTIADEDVGGFGSSTFGIQLAGPRLVLFGGDGSRGEIVFPEIWIRQ